MQTPRELQVPLRFIASGHEYCQTQGMIRSRLDREALATEAGVEAGHLQEARHNHRYDLDEAFPMMPHSPVFDEWVGLTLNLSS